MTKDPGPVMTHAWYFVLEATGEIYKLDDQTNYYAGNLAAKALGWVDGYTGNTIIREDMYGFEILARKDYQLPYQRIGFLWDENNCIVPPMHPQYFAYKDACCVDCFHMHPTDKPCSKGWVSLNILHHPYISDDARSYLEQVWENTKGKKPRKRFDAVRFAAACYGVPESAIWLLR